MPKYHINLKRIDLIDRKLPFFILFKTDKFNKSFQILNKDTLFNIRFGIIENLPQIHSFTEIDFETEWKIDLAIFEREIPLIVDTEQLQIKSIERVNLENQKETEKNNIENQLRTTFPLVLEAVNTLRRACKIALFKESIAGRMLATNIRANQEYRGGEVNHSLIKLFYNNDAEFLFGAFADISLIAFSGDADIEYKISDKDEHVLSGVIKNGYRGLRSTNLLMHKLTDIQNLINEGWPIEEDVLLSSLEFLCAGNYKMAVFNAATLLELVVVKFWEDKNFQLSSGDRKEREKAASLERALKKSKKTVVEKILEIVIPDFINPNLIKDGTVNRCITAWKVRNEKLAHLHIQVEEKTESDISAEEAWNLVSSIYSFHSEIKNA